MQFSWLKRTGAAKLIVVFGGWALGPGMLSHLAGSYDVLFAEDYRDLNTGLPDLTSYREASLVAYSFGVAAYGHWQKDHGFHFDRKVAVNGSLTPVHQKTGITPLRFSHTVGGLNNVLFQEFVARSYGKKQRPVAIDIAARKAELLAIEARGDAPFVDFDRIWISRADQIIAPANQARGWGDQSSNLRFIDAPHVPFAHWGGWHQVLE